MTFADACLSALSGSRIRCRGWAENVTLSWHAVFGWAVHWKLTDGAGEHTADHAHPHPTPLDVRRTDWEVVK